MFLSNKNLVDNQFDDIAVAITKSWKEVDLDIINRNQKTFEP